VISPLLLKYKVRIETGKHSISKGKNKKGIKQYKFPTKYKSLRRTCDAMLCFPGPTALDSPPHGSATPPL
jgi:hypothetical protein